MWIKIMIIVENVLLGFFYMICLAVAGYVVVRSWSAAYYKSYFEALQIYHHRKEGD